MAPIFTGGAFVQQCFAVHPLSLNVKVFSPPDKLGILCTNCSLRHRLTGETFSMFIGEEQAVVPGALEALTDCITSHPQALRVSTVAVDQAIVQLRCGECKRGYQLHVRRFETHQK